MGETEADLELTKIRVAGQKHSDPEELIMWLWQLLTHHVDQLVEDLHKGNTGKHAQRFAEIAKGIMELMEEVKVKGVDALK